MGALKFSDVSRSGLTFDPADEDMTYTIRGNVAYVHALKTKENGNKVFYKDPSSSVGYGVFIMDVASGPFQGDWLFIREVGTREVCPLTQDEDGIHLDSSGLLSLYFGAG